MTTKTLSSSLYLRGATHTAEGAATYYDRYDSVSRARHMNARVPPYVLTYPKQQRRKTFPRHWLLFAWGGDARFIHVEQIVCGRFVVFFVRFWISALTLTRAPKRTHKKKLSTLTHTASRRYLSKLTEFFAIFVTWTTDWLQLRMAKGEAERTRVISVGNFCCRLRGTDSNFVSNLREF